MRSLTNNMQVGFSAALLAISLSACGVNAAAHPPVQAAAAQATVQPVATRTPQASPVPESHSVSGTGMITAERQAQLGFLVQGRVSEVLVKEGQIVKQGDRLALLDPRPFDVIVAQAEAAVAAARAQQRALDEAPRAADLRAAQAQVQQAQIGVAQAQNGQSQDLRAAEAAKLAAEASLQDARDTLSLAKTAAEQQLKQAAQLLTQAQAQYAQAKYNWEYAEKEDRDPLQPTVVVNGKPVPNRLSDGAREAYYARFVQAEAAMHQAEAGVAQAQLQYEYARQAEVTNLQAAEQQVVQAQTTMARLQVPKGEDRVAAAQAALALAQANVARLTVDPNPSQRALAEAGVAQAEAALAQARLNREYAELQAPFDGVVVRRRLEVGEATGPTAPPALVLIDMKSMRFEVPIADADIALLQPGQPVVIQLDALPEQPINGTIRYIADAAEAQGAVRTYLVRVSLPTSTMLRIGMSGVARFHQSAP